MVRTHIISEHVNDSDNPMAILVLTDTKIWLVLNWSMESQTLPCWFLDTHMGYWFLTPLLPIFQFDGGGNWSVRRKSLTITCHNSMTNFITQNCIKYLYTLRKGRNQAPNIHGDRWRNWMVKNEDVRFWVSNDTY